MSGQITLDTAFGRELATLAADPSYRVYVEVGTWKGQGSTLCFAEGFKARSDCPSLVSIEANYLQWAIARKFWDAQEKNFRLHILHARLGEKMMSESEVREHPRFEQIKEHFDLYFKEDVRDFALARKVSLRAADVVLLDGGEFASEGDWAALEGLCPRVVCLDDVNVMKNGGILERLLAAGWKLVWRSDERNGAAILERPDAVLVSSGPDAAEAANSVV